MQVYVKNHLKTENQLFSYYLRENNNKISFKRLTLSKEKLLFNKKV